MFHVTRAVLFLCLSRLSFLSAARINECLLVGYTEPYVYTRSKDKSRDICNGPPLEKSLKKQTNRPFSCIIIIYSLQFERIRLYLIHTIQTDRKVFLLPKTNDGRTLSTASVSTVYVPHMHNITVTLDLRHLDVLGLLLSI